MQTPRIYLGTSGWSYPSGPGKWKGVFYPKRWSGDELAYYAERFPAVEVNSTFYRIPAPSSVHRWVEATPKEFRFAVKLFRKFTHPEFFAKEEDKSPGLTSEDIAGMRETLEILGEGGKLGALLVQYPDFYFKNDEHVSQLVRTLDLFRDYPLAVEMRNRTWDNGHTRDMLEFFRAAYVRIDEPLYQNLDEPYAPPKTLQYWRFHGRNTAMWRKRGAGEARYDYLYPPEEIDRLADSVKRHANPEEDNFVFFNNHPGGKAPANAVMLAYRMGLPLPYQRFANLANVFEALRPITGEEGGQLAL
ncbi:MAG: DUF72 domain-containing protein [Armatimonadota bacterium]